MTTDEAPTSLVVVRQVCGTFKRWKGSWCLQQWGAVKLGGKALPEACVQSWLKFDSQYRSSWLKKRGGGCPYLEMERDSQDCNNSRGMSLFSVPGKVSVLLLLVQICSQMLKLRRYEVRLYVRQVDRWPYPSTSCTSNAPSQLPTGHACNVCQSQAGVWFCMPRGTLGPPASCGFRQELLVIGPSCTQRQRVP